MWGEMIKKRTVVFIVLIAILITSAATFFFVTEKKYVTEGKTLVKSDEYTRLKNIEKRFKKVIDMEKRIKKDYYQDVSEIDFDDAILKGLFEGLDDPYSKYLNKEDYKKYMDDISGSYSGIGVYINTKDKAGYIKIKEVMEKSPAMKAKLLAEDIILKVNGDEVFVDKIDEAISKIKGESGTKVRLTIRRGEEEFDVDVTRETIDVPSVKSEIKDSDIGYIKLSAFQQDSASDFNSALEKLLAKNIKSLVIDLRFNPGGSLFEVNKIADRLLGEQVIETIVDRQDKREVISSDEKNKIDIPMVVLVNEYSASASEILTAAIKDTNSGTIIGQKTFGKGIVQTIKAYGDGTYYKITTAHYLTPNGNNIHKKGVDVDIDEKQIKAKGYKISSDNDGVLNYALDFLKGKQCI